MKSVTILQSSVLAAAAVLLSGCNLAPRYEQPVLPVAATVGAQAGEAAVASEASLALAKKQGWIQSAQLQELVAVALTHNRDLRIAVDSVERARAQYGITRADRLPGVAVQGQASRSRTAADLSNTGRASVSEQYIAQLGFTSYEIDFWGRVRNLNESALQAFLQSDANRRSVEIALVAEVGNAWLTLAADMARLQLARDTLISREKAYELTRRMFELGATSDLVLAQNLSTVEAARGDVAAYTAQVERSRNALQLLAGGPVPDRLLPSARTLASEDAQTTLLLQVPAPLPSTALLRRPDVQAAEYNLRSMNANIGAARAALFPTISLTGNLGTGSRELDALFGSGNGTWSFMPQIRMPIFDGGRSRAGVALAEANQRIALAQYEKTVQVAFRETADVLADRAQWKQRLGAQEGVVNATRKAFTLSEARFKAGVDNFLTVLDAQRSLYAAQQALISLRLAEQINRLTLWKVLGGEGSLGEHSAQ